MNAKKIMKSIARKAGLTFLWAGSLSMTFSIIALFALWGALVWMITPEGQKFVRDIIPQQISVGPYKLDITGLSYSIPAPFELDQIKIREGDDVILDASDIKLVLNPEETSKQDLDLSFTVHVHDKPINIKIELAFTQDKVLLESISLKGPDINVSGSGSYTLADKSLDAKLSGRIESFHNYPELVGSAHNIAPLSFIVTLSQQEGEEIYAVFEANTQKYANREINIAAQDISLKGTYANGVITITSLNARDQDKGKFNASGTFEPDGGLADLSIKAREVNILKGEIASGVLDGDMKMQGAAKEGYLVSGTITAQKLNITIPQRLSGSVPQLNVKVKGQNGQKTKASAADIIKLDVRINAPQRVVVRGWGLDAEFGGTLDVKGTAAGPLFYGDFTALRGRYSEFGKVFKFTNAKMNFSGAVPPNPVLDIETKTKAGDITAIVNIAGPVMSPKISFSSEPPLPEDEVLSHILFGAETGKLSPLQAVRLAQTLNRFTGNGGSAGTGLSAIDPIGTLRSVTGLDDLRVETNEEGAASFGAGKYLTDKVYLEFETGTQEDSSNANVQIELTPNVTLESEIGQDASGGAGIFWKWDY